jgi:tRNA threonylcarbamoyladenosine biosynthesis protein TsaB
VSGLVLAFDTATAATVVGVGRDGAPVVARRHDPGPGERPGHATQLLALVEDALAEAGGALADVTRIGVGVGPGSFTGLRIGVATGRALAQATGAEAVTVSTLDALAWGLDAVGAPPAGPVLAVLDARRGEAFVAAWDGGARTLAPGAVAPEALGALGLLHAAGGAAVGDGAIRYRAQLEDGGVAVPADGAPEHLVRGEALVALARVGEVVSRERLVPDYLRVPDVDLRP